MEQENVCYIYEKHMKKRVFYSIFVCMLCALFLFFIQKVIVPIICVFLILLCFFLGITPKDDTPVAWVLTNKRYIQIHLNEEKCVPIQIDLEGMTDVGVVRAEELHSNGIDLVADILLFPIELVFHSIRDRWKKTKEIRKLNIGVI